MWPWFDDHRDKVYINNIFWTWTSLALGAAITLKLLVAPDYSIWIIFIYFTNRLHENIMLGVTQINK